MNEANTMADITGDDHDGSIFPVDPLAPKSAAPRSPTVDNTLVRGFCGYLTADIPQLHGIHPQVIADSWERFKARVADGFYGLHFDAPERHENGDGR